MLLWRPSCLVLSSLSFPHKVVVEALGLHHFIVFVNNKVYSTLSLHIHFYNQFPLDKQVSSPVSKTPGFFMLQAQEAQILFYS